MTGEEGEEAGNEMRKRLRDREDIIIKQEGAGRRGDCWDLMGREGWVGGGAQENKGRPVYLSLCQSLSKSREKKQCGRLQRREERERERERDAGTECRRQARFY